MCSSDVQSLFTTSWLRETAEIIFSSIGEWELSSSILLSIDEHRSILLLCTEDVKFFCDHRYSKQTDVVERCRPLVSVIADILTSQVESKTEKCVPRVLSFIMDNYVMFW